MCVFMCSVCVSSVCKCDYVCVCEVGVRAGLRAAGVGEGERGGEEQEREWVCSLYAACRVACCIERVEEGGVARCSGLPHKGMRLHRRHPAACSGVLGAERVLHLLGAL